MKEVYPFNRMVNEEEENVLVIVFLLMKFGSIVLQKKFQKECPDPKKFFEKKKHEILHLTLNKQCCVANCNMDNRPIPISRRNLNLMYDTTWKSCLNFKNCCSCHFVPKSKFEIDNWDITLTSCLLLEVCPSLRASDRKPIENLRKLRNDNLTLHRGNVVMLTYDYNTTFTDLSHSIKDIAATCDQSFHRWICDEIEELQTDRITTQKMHKAQLYLRQIENMVKCMEDLRDELRMALKQTTEMNIERYSKSCIQQNVTYVEPKTAMDCSIDLLCHHKFVIITGDAGTGKSCFCHRLMSQMEILYPNISAKILTRPCELRELDATKGYILFIDDVVGKSDAKQRAFDKWSKQFDYMYTLLSKKSDVFIIFASRNGVWDCMKNDFLDYTLFRTLNKTSAPVIDLSGEDFKMTFEEKSNMLKMFCKHKGVRLYSSLKEYTKTRKLSNGTLCLSQELFDSLTEIDTPPGFPFLCEQFFSDQSSLDQGLHFFKVHSASYGVKKQVDKLLLNDQYLHYAVLISIFHKYSSYKKYDFYVTIDEEDIVDIGSVKPEEIIPIKIKSCLEGLLKTFIISSDKGYKFKHLVVYEAILLSFSENFPKIFLETISKEVLFTYVRTESYKSEKNEVIVRLPNKLIKCLAKKLVEVFGSSTENPYIKTYTHPSFRDKELACHFLDVVERDVTFRIFLNSFIAGACKESNDILGCETIKRFSNTFDFDPEIFSIALSNDLIDTYKEFLNNGEFRELFFKNLFEEESSDNYLATAFNYTARNCIMHMLDLFDNEYVLRTDEDINNSIFIPSLLKTIYRIEIYFGNNWIDALRMKVIKSMWRCKK